MMVSVPRILHVEPGGELDRLLDDDMDTPVEVEKDGVRYRLTRVETPSLALPSADDIARSIAGIRRAAGGWKDLVDSDALTDYVYERRRTANRPSVVL